ncbi:MAG: thioredoxin domain-containing protein [Chloroflexota bacterium]
MRNIFLLSLLLLLLSACAQPSNPQVVGEVAPAEAALASTPVVESAASSAGQASSPTAAPNTVSSSAAGNGMAIEVDPASAQTDAYGLPVGFTVDGHAYRGDPAAPVVIQEYSDYQCPFCTRFYQETLPTLKENQIANGEVLFIYYDFPLTSIHPQAEAAANAARCAGEQGAANYWAMHDAIFAKSEEWSNNRANEVFATYAEGIGLDVTQFKNCVANQTYGAAVSADIESGRGLGVNSTPSFFLNGQALIGAQPLAVFNEAIATILDGGQLASAQPQPTAGPRLVPTPATISEEGTISRGAAEAQVTIIEFSDYQCPYCQRHSAETLPQIISQMVDTGRVRYVFKDFPLDSIHPDARSAAVAAHCANEQEAYWEMHDLLFGRQSEWAGQGANANEVYKGFATELSLDPEAFASCLVSGRYDAVIQASVDEGRALGVSGTPTFFINGFPVSGARPMEVFDYAVGLAEEGKLADAYVQEAPAAEPTPNAGPVEVPIGDAYVMGDENAPVTIVEYTDFQCPYCQRHFLETYPQLMEQYVETGIVRYVFKDFPLTDLHPQALQAHEAARCARDQEAFVEMHDLLFANQSEWAGQEDVATIFTGYATELGLDVATFTACFAGHKYEQAILATVAEGAGLGVTGTPSFFINGYLLPGAYPLSTFDQAITVLQAEQN